MARVLRQQHVQLCQWYQSDLLELEGSTGEGEVTFGTGEIGGKAIALLLLHRSTRSLFMFGRSTANSDFVMCFATGDNIPAEVAVATQLG